MGSTSSMARRFPRLAGLALLVSIHACSAAASPPHSRRRLARLRPRRRRLQVLAPRPDHPPERRRAGGRLALGDRRSPHRGSGSPDPRAARSPRQLRSHPRRVQRHALLHHLLQPRDRAGREHRRAHLGLRPAYGGVGSAAQRHRFRAPRRGRVERAGLSGASSSTRAGGSSRWTAPPASPSSRSATAARSTSPRTSSGAPTGSTTRRRRRPSSSRTCSSSATASGTASSTRATRPATSRRSTCGPGNSCGPST